MCRRMPKWEGGACQEVGISGALAGDREAVLPAWRDTSPRHGTHQELNSHRPAAIPGQVCRSPEIFLGTGVGEWGTAEWNENYKLSEKFSA